MSIRAREAAANVEKFMDLIHRHTSSEELTHIPWLVKKTPAHKAVALDAAVGKQRRQKIEIHYLCAGKVDVPSERHPAKRTDRWSRDDQIADAAI